MTVSLDSPEKMIEDALAAKKRGFTTLKIKVGGDPLLDIDRLQMIRDGVGNELALRIDANQGWNAKQAVRVARELERRNITIELMEQPVPANDYEGLRYVRDNVSVPVYGDESVFSPRDALELVSMKAVDGLNIKLMKCGGIYNALKIAAIAEAAGIPCMIGSMMECNISVTAAAHLAASRTIIGKYDLDAALFCSVQPAQGGIRYDGPSIRYDDSPGLGLHLETARK
jgi:L-alanine-DL-glutamate epimerase-like enolase superfamily enzyme